MFFYKRENVMSIKKMAVAGQFYPVDENELREEIKGYTENLQKECDYFSRAVIVPHAGHVYSGALAAKGYQYLKKELDTIFVFAPCHRVYVETFALSTADEFETPLGNVGVNKAFQDELKALGGVENDDAFLNEHSVEVQLPFIKTYFENSKIVPVLVGGADQNKIFEIINKYWDNKNIGFVISSDLSHFRPREEAQRVDFVTADMIENNVFENLLPEQACGYKAVAGLLEFAKSKNYSMIRVGITDSSETTKDPSSVVGYGSWYLAEEEKTKFFKDNFQEVLRKLAVLSVKSQLDNLNLRIENCPRALETRLASFVTLIENGILRGCIGSIAAHQPLVVDICQNARNAAFKDPRFTPVQANEFEKLQFAVSLLSRPEKIDFNGEEDLLEKLVPEVDGLIIRDAGRQAVYLPEVWKQLPDKKEFLNSLKQKAGLTPEWFSDTFEAYRFKTELV